MVRFSMRVSFRLRLVSGLYKWLFYLVTVRQLNHVVYFKKKKKETVFVDGI